MSNPRVRIDGLPDGRHTRKVTHPTRGNDWPKDRWYPELIGEKHYPKTQESWQKRNDVLTANRAGAIAAGKMTRRGVPDGRAGQKGQLEVELRNAKTEAEMLVPVLFPDFDPDAREAMGVAVTMMRCVHNVPSIRLTATRIVLDWSAARLPAGVNPVADSCESILAALG